MVLQMQTRTTRQATPERWQRTVSRAISERIEVRQVNARGQWIASSGSRANVAYILGVTRGVAHSCTCEAGQAGDPVCLHRAAYWYAIGVLEPEPPAPVADCECAGWRTRHCPGYATYFEKLDTDPYSDTSLSPSDRPARICDHRPVAHQSR